MLFTLFADKQLEQLGKVIDEGLDAKLKPINEKLDTLELKVEAIHVQNKKDHAEIMDKLVTSNETNGEELRKLDERVTILEKPFHKN